MTRSLSERYRAVASATVDESPNPARPPPAAKPIEAAANSTGQDTRKFVREFLVELLRATVLEGHLERYELDVTPHATIVAREHGKVVATHPQLVGRHMAGKLPVWAPCAHALARVHLFERSFDQPSAMVAVGDEEGTFAETLGQGVQFGTGATLLCECVRRQRHREPTPEDSLYLSEQHALAIGPAAMGEE